MFKRKVLAVSEPMLRGWRRSELEWLATSLTGEEPMIAIRLLGINHSMKVDGTAYRSAVKIAEIEQETYQGMPHIFDDRPRPRPEQRLIGEECKLSGLMAYSRAEVAGTFAVAGNPGKLAETGLIGHLSITTIDIDKANLRPLLEFYMEFLDGEKLAEMRTSIQIALSGKGIAWANFAVEPIADKNAWIAYFEAKGYSPSLVISRVYLNAQSGKMIDD